LSMTQKQRLQLGLDAPVAEEWCLHCLRVLSSDATVVCRKVDYMARCDRCIKARKPGCLSVGSPSKRLRIADGSQVPTELRHEAKVVQDAWSHFNRATGQKEAGWADVMQARAHRFRLRSMALDRLKKRAPIVKTAVEVGALVADRMSDIDDTLRELVSRSSAPLSPRCLCLDSLERVTRLSLVLAALLLAIQRCRRRPSMLRLPRWRLLGPTLVRWRMVRRWRSE
jgi:hypothetical protein